MPLIGKKIFVCSKPLKDLKDDEEVFTIKHTKEQFRSKSEYEARKSWYEEPIWTCRCTGHIALTHEQAWKSEKAVVSSLKQQFSKYHEKTVLEIVHHSTATLDTLVDQAWLKIQQVFSINEPVSFKVKGAEGKSIEGTILKINTTGVDANPTSNCNSPSSDKENHLEDSSHENSPKKWMPPKLLPYKYSIALNNEDKVINEVPAADLVRNEKPPSKETLRLFIRSHALRLGSNPTSPWVVDEAQVKKNGLESKLSDFLMGSFILTPPYEIYGTPKFKEDKKRRLSSPASSSAKKQRLDNSAKKQKTKDSKKQVTLTGSPLKKSTSGSKLKSPLKKVKSGENVKGTPPKKSPSKNAVVIDSDSDEDDQPLSVLKSSPKKTNSHKKSAKIKEKNKTPTKKKKINNHVVSVDSDSEEDKPLAKLKGLKQMTLFDMSKKKGLKTPEKKHSSKRSPSKGQKTPEKRKIMSPPRTPAVVSQLIKAVKANNQPVVKNLLLKSATLLSADQRRRAPAEVKEMIQKKYEQIELKKRLKNMTPEEKEEYRKQKKAEQKKIIAAKQRELNKKYEDQTLESLKALPPPKLVPTPEGMPNELFGDVTMVTEFISCYSGLLMPDESYPILTDALMKSLCSGKEGFYYLSRALVCLLQTLLQDGISEDYEEMKVPLSEIPVNQYTASELVRLCLRNQDSNDGDEGDEEEDAEVPEEIMQLLDTQEFFQLEPAQKVQILKGLCLRIMSTYSVQDYMETRQQDAGELWKRKISELKEKNSKLKKEKDEKKDQKFKAKDEQEETKEPNKKDNGVLLSHFYGKSTESRESSKPSTPTGGTPAESEEEGGDDLVSVVRRRRLLAARTAAEKEQRDIERRIQKEREYEEYRKIREKENFEKTFNEGIALAKQVLRKAPIGTDRHHQRYWVFSSATPGLFIEKGWVSDYIDYSYSGGEEVAKDYDVEEESSRNIGTTVPKTGQNLWFTYDTTKELDTLIENLHPQGVRESALKKELKKRYADVSRAINISKRTTELRDADGEKDMLEGFRKELLETELKLRNGGLGGVIDFPLWDSKLQSATDFKALGSLLVECQENVLEKFRQGTMSPKKKKVKVEGVKEEETADDQTEENDEEDEDGKMEVEGIVQWREAVESANTLSRLHVLLGILDSSIRWEKSAENAKCKICRKKGNDERLLLCDDCNQAFHIFCLRPALSEIPKGDWFCVSCMPLDQRRKSKPYSSNAFSGSEEEDESDIEHEDNCVECGGDEGLIFCAECPSAYHPECHNPPLRRPPRGRWVCEDCKNGGSKRKTRSKTQTRNARKQKRAPPKRKHYEESEESENESEEEEEDEDEEEDEEEEETEEETRTSRRQSGRTATRQQSSSSIANRGTEGRRSGSTSRPQRNSTGTGNTAPERTRSSSSRRAPSDLSICEQIIDDVMKHESCWPFLYPVCKKEVPDYHKIIKHAMDFQTVKNKLSVLVYGSADEMIEDVKLIFNNAEIYNKVGSEVLDCMVDIEKYFASLVKKNLSADLYFRAKLTNGAEEDEPSPPPSKRSRR